ncbi:hypothetical protein RND71_005966 [Anisodus tanguticus]|uniref:Uncharacterized protein n=1 Tax=Anisodus tanguticus TaxID=243964 RepID=A0AAE1SSW7_9SOLA|nr:hypothetical protein RND71_005966 [Anisodus tanguticus]
MRNTITQIQEPVNAESEINMPEILNTLAEYMGVTVLMYPDYNLITPFDFSEQAIVESNEPQVQTQEVACEENDNNRILIVFLTYLSAKDDKVTSLLDVNFVSKNWVLGYIFPNMMLERHRLIGMFAPNTRQAFTPEQINEACYVDINGNKAVKLKKVLMAVGLLQVLVKYGYCQILTPREDIAFPNDPPVPIKVDDDLKQLFRGIELPRDMLDIEKDL